jgi:hypothetical protein
MLARLVLLAAQLVAGWLATEPILERLPPFAGLRIFVYGLVAAVVVFIVGLVLSQILRDTGAPSRATLASHSPGPCRGGPRLFPQCFAPRGAKQHPGRA